MREVKALPLDAMRMGCVECSSSEFEVYVHGEDGQPIVAAFCCARCGTGWEVRDGIVGGIPAAITEPCPPAGRVV